MSVKIFLSAVTSNEALSGHNSHASKHRTGARVSPDRAFGSSKCLTFASSLVILIVSLVLAGCGSGGYAGAGITGLSTSSFTIDAGQSFPVTATLSGKDALVSWSLAGSTCSGSSSGSLSNETGSQVTYTAPAELASQVKLTLTAAVSGTSSLSRTSITVNPAGG